MPLGKDVEGSLELSFLIAFRTRRQLGRDRFRTRRFDNIQ